MPETPTAAAMEAARKLWTETQSHKHSPATRWWWVKLYATVLDAFAAEHCGADVKYERLEGERDAALARAEAAEAQGARNIDLLLQVARLRSHMRCIAQACQEHGEATAVAQQALQDGQYPADLLAAVRHMDDAPGAGRDKAHATLVRYGLLPAAPVEDAP